MFLHFCGTNFVETALFVLFPFFKTNKQTNKQTQNAKLSEVTALVCLLQITVLWIELKE